MRFNHATSTRLFRSLSHPNHWIVWSDRAGWQIFPAKFHGWEERRPHPEADLARLNQVPLWMGFNTGLLEALVSRAA